MGRQGDNARAFHIGADGVRIHYALSRPDVGRFAFYLAVIALAVLVWRLQSSMFSQSYIEAQIEDLTPLEARQLDAFLQMNSLLVTLGTAVMGALGFLIGAGKRSLSWRELLPASVSAVLAGCSLYFGYLAYQGILWMLQSSFFDLDNPAIQWTRRAHFYTLLGSAFFFADFMIHALGKDDAHEDAKQAAVS